MRIQLNSSNWVNKNVGPQFLSEHDDKEGFPTRSKAKLQNRDADDQ